MTKVNIGYLVDQSWGVFVLVFNKTLDNSINQPMKRLSKFWQLNFPEKMLLCLSFLILVLVRLGLFLLSFAKLKQLVDQNPQIIYNQQYLTQLSPDKIAWAVKIVSTLTLPSPAKCLARALTTQVLLRFCGYQSTLVIGVTKNLQGDLDSHAWVEIKGKILIGDSPYLSRYQVLIKTK